MGGAELASGARRASVDRVSNSRLVLGAAVGGRDRLVYDNYEPLIALAAAAVTERIRLATTILIAPGRANGALVAKVVVHPATLTATAVPLSQRDEERPVRRSLPR